MNIERAHGAPVALITGASCGLDEALARVRAALRAIGPFAEEAKKDLDPPRPPFSGFARVHPRKSSLILNLCTERPIANLRVVRIEQVSKNRYHSKIGLDQPNGSTGLLA